MKKMLITGSVGERFMVIAAQQKRKNHRNLRRDLLKSGSGIHFPNFQQPPGNIKSGQQIPIRNRSGIKTNEQMRGCICS